MNQTITIPLWVNLPPRTTYYSLELDAERCPSFSLFYAYEHHEICLSSALRPCDFRNGKSIQLLDRQLAEMLASYAEPIMQKRYGSASLVNVIECSCPEATAKPTTFAEHATKAEALISKFRNQGAPRSSESKALKVAQVVDLERES